MKVADLERFLGEFGCPKLPESAEGLLSLASEEAQVVKERLLYGAIKDGTGRIQWDRWPDNESQHRFEFELHPGKNPPLRYREALYRRQAGIMFPQLEVLERSSNGVLKRTESIQIEEAGRWIPTEQTQLLPDDEAVTRSQVCMTRTLVPEDDVFQVGGSADVLYRRKTETALSVPYAARVEGRLFTIWHNRLMGDGGRVEVRDDEVELFDTQGNRGIFPAEVDYNGIKEQIEEAFLSVI